MSTLQSLRLYMSTFQSLHWQQKKPFLSFLRHLYCQQVLDRSIISKSSWNGIWVANGGRVVLEGGLQANKVVNCGETKSNTICMTILSETPYWV